MDHERERIRRVYVPALTGSRVGLQPEELHHVRNVLRLSPGAALELFDGQGTVATGRVVSLDRHAGVVEVESVRTVERPRPGVHVAFAVPKGKRLDWLLEKATELGVASLRPVTADRSVAGRGTLSAAAERRWRAHCIAAARQCGLNHLPDLHPTAPVGELLSGGRFGRPAFVGDLSDDAEPIVAALADASTATDIGLLVGPEGGFTDAEREAIRVAGFRAVRLGETTLRVETAAVALVAAVRAVLGSWQPV